LNRIRFSLSLAIFWLALTTVLLCLPGSALPDRNWFSTIQLDKWIHIGLFGVLVFVWCGAIRRKVDNPVTIKNYFLGACSFAIAYGVAMEFVQDAFIANRSFDVWDICADAAGCVAGWYFSRRYFN